MQGLCARSPKRCPVKMSAQGLYKMSLGKTLEEISLEEISTEDLCEGPPSKISINHQVSVQDLYERSLGKICVQDL